MGMRDGSFSHFSNVEKWEKEPSLIPIFPWPCRKMIATALKKVYDIR